MRMGTLSKLVMIEQTVFGLTWVFASALLPFASPLIQKSFSFRDWPEWAGMVLAYLFARSAGMSFNRLIDRHIDEANPRTCKRPIPSGEISSYHAAWFAWVCILMFVLSCYLINRLCFQLSPLIIALLWGYSYMKRFSAACHFFLGGIHFFAPICAWIVITGNFDLPPLFLGAALLASIAGNDIIYATQDLEFDRQNGLHSIPANFGLQKSFILAQFLQFIAVILLFCLGIILQLHCIYYVGVCLIAGIYLLQGFLLKRTRGQIEVNQAFFYCNVAVGSALLISVIGEILWNVLL